MRGEHAAAMAEQERWHQQKLQQKQYKLRAAEENAAVVEWSSKQLRAECTALHHDKAALEAANEQLVADKHNAAGGQRSHAGAECPACG